MVCPHCGRKIPPFYQAGAKMVEQTRSGHYYSGLMPSAGRLYANMVHGGTGLFTDEDIQTMIYNTVDNDPLVPYNVTFNAEVEAGEVALTGIVPSKRVKHAIGDDAWWVPGVVDVKNNLKIRDVQIKNKGF